MATSQSINGVVFDSESKKTIVGAHIVVKNKMNVGSITNNDGKFLMSKNFLSDTLIVSHINYQPQEVIFRNNLVINLQAKSITLKEITVSPLEVSKIIESVFDNLEDNHYNEENIYQFFFRAINYQNDSMLNLIEEHQGFIQHNKNSNSKFSIDQSRLTALSNSGKNSLDDYRFIKLVSKQSDNVFKYLEDYLHHRKNKRYKYNLEDVFLYNGRETYKISYSTDKDTYYKKGYLLIDKSTKALVRNVLDHSDYYQINYVIEGDKWYLSNSYHRKIRGNYSEEIIMNYQKIDDLNPDKEFQSAFALSPAKLSKSEKTYANSYWEFSNVIPLPDWVLSQINEIENK
ncbi:MAG: carboxypeptidase-like regulatory domain-containing protein [Marivirga sp.]